jgi:prophage regulatory protein
MNSNLQRIAPTLVVTGVGRSGHYKAIAEGLFTKPVKISGRAVGWPTHEVEQINRAKIAGFNDDQIRELVTKLHAQRKALAPSLARGVE